MNNRFWLTRIVVLGLLLGSGGRGPATSLSVRAELAGAVLYVKAAPGGAMNCTSWQNACYLQDALAGAGAGDEIWVAQGRHYPDQGGGQTAGDRRAAFRLKEGAAIAKALGLSLDDIVSS